MNRFEVFIQIEIGINNHLDRLLFSVFLQDAVNYDIEIQIMLVNVVFGNYNLFERDRANIYFPAFAVPFDLRNDIVIKTLCYER